MAVTWGVYQYVTGDVEGHFELQSLAASINKVTQKETYFLLFLSIDGNALAIDIIIKAWFSISQVRFINLILFGKLVGSFYDS